MQLQKSNQFADTLRYATERSSFILVRESLHYSVDKSALLTGEIGPVGAACRQLSHDLRTRRRAHTLRSLRSAF